MAADIATELKQARVELAEARRRRDEAETRAAQVEKAAPGRTWRGTPPTGVPAAAPHVTTGPVGRDSAGFSLLKALAAHRGFVSKEQAKGEIEACTRFEKALVDCRYDLASREPDTFLIPLGFDLLTEDVLQHEDARYFKSMWAAGSTGADPDEAAWLARRTRFKAAMSYLQDTIGGELVPPPVQGDLIELIRPKECLMAAGATNIGLPPNGRMVFPRQTGPTTMYWVNENTEITESNPTTGQIALQAKKAGVLTRIPNELLKFATPSADALIRSDMAKTIALGIDYAGLYGTGGTAQPKGLARYTDANQVIDYAGLAPAPKGVGAHGNTLRPEDGYRMVGLIEDRNFDFGRWIFRPTMANNIMGYRGDAAAPDDAAGGFVQSFMRSVADRMAGENWCGYGVVKSAVVRNDQTKGNGTALTEVFGGQWEHLMVGTYGAVELATANQGDATFAKDQTLIRALVHVDIAPRYEGAFVWYKQLLNTMK